MPVLAPLTPERVVLPISSTRKVDAIREIACLFQSSCSVTDFRRFLSALLQQEQRFGSGVEKGVALSHYRDETIVDPVIGLGISKQGIDWGDGSVVNILVLIGWPDKHQKVYLQTIAQLASALHQSSIRSKVLEATDTDTIVKAIKSSVGSD